MLRAVGVATTVPLLLLSAPADPPPISCVAVDSLGRCLVAAVDPGREGGPESPDRDDESASDVDAGGDGPPSYEPSLVAMPQGGGWVVGPPPEEEPPPAGAEVTAVDPDVLALLAIRQLDLAAPVARTSGVDRVFVGVPLWLWIEDGPAYTGPISATAAAGAATVTATGRLTGVEWSMGPPGAVVRCRGTGTPWRGEAGASPDCGYVYELRSLPERTGGSGRWPIVVTSVWAVTWTGTSGGVPVAGQQILRVSSETSLAVGEVQVLVGGDR